MSNKEKIEALESIAKRIILLDDECQDPKYAVDNESIIRIIGDIAEEGRKVMKIKKEPPAPPPPPPKRIINEDVNIRGYIPIPDERPVYGGENPYQNNRTY